LNVFSNSTASSLDSGVLNYRTSISMETDKETETSTTKLAL
jgi:hypothetical protein